MIADLTNPTNLKHRHATDLDGVRGVFAFCVVLLHFGFDSFFTRVSHGIFHGAVFQLCVDAFFILSGFVLTGSLSRSKLTPALFARRRFFRLAPVFFLTTGLSFLATTPDYDWRYAPLELLAGLPLIGRDPANGPSWSVSWEFYLPIIAYTSSRWLPRLSLLERRIALILALIVLGLLDSYVMWANILYFPRALFGLLTGHLLYRSEMSNLINWQSWMNPTLVILSLVIMFIASEVPYISLVFPLMVCLLVLSGASRDSSILSSLPFQWLGLISYTLYMVHVPVLQIGHTLLGQSFEQNAPAKLIAIAFSLVLATMLTYLFEIPFMNYGKRITQTI